MRVCHAFAIVTALFFLSHYPAVVAAEEVHVFQTDSRYYYRTELLQLALSYTNQQDEYEPIRIVLRSDLPTPRARRLLLTGELRGVMSLATNSEREQRFLPIRVPIMAGILGMRVFLIKEKYQPLFDELDSFEQLQQIPLGFVRHWGDIQVLEHNNMTIIPTSRYDTTFAMLNAERFHFFPRGVNEAFNELNRFKPEIPDLTIETHNALFYPYPVYFFVNKNDTELATRIEYGLRQALEDGSFRKLFNQHHQQLLKKLNFDNRRIFYLENPTLPESAEKLDMSWWLVSE